MNQSNRMSVSRKIFLIAGSFSLPIAVLVWLMIGSINSYIQFGSLEMSGNAYQKSLERVLDSLQTHQMARLADPLGESPKTAQAASAVDSALVTLDQTQKQWGSTLQFTAGGLAKRGREHLSPATLRSEWSHAVTANADTAAQYDHLIADVRGMITHAGDISNLILDPDLDSYYLMDVTLLALPQMQDRLGKIMAANYGPLAAGKPLTDAQRVALAVEKAKLQESDMDRVAVDTQTVLNEDANFYGASPTLEARMKAAMEAWSAATSRFAGMLERQAASADVVVDPGEFMAAGEQARRASFDYWNVAVAELDTLLKTRLGSYRSERATALFLAGLATLGAALLSFFLMRSITRPLDGLVQSLGPGATLLAASVERISQNSKDESADPVEAEIICEELTAHVEKMRHAVLELAFHVQGADAESRMRAATGERVGA